MSVTKRNEPEGGGCISRWMWTSSLGGNRRTPFSPQIKPLFCRSCAVPRALPRCGRACRAGRRPSGWALRFPSSDWTVSQGWGGGASPFSDWDLEGGRADRQLLKVPGPMPPPTQPLRPQTSGSNDNWSGGGERVSFLLGPRAFGKVLEAGRIDRGPVSSSALDPEKAEQFL